MLSSVYQDLQYPVPIQPSPIQPSKKIYILTIVNAQKRIALRLFPPTAAMTFVLPACFAMTLVVNRLSLKFATDVAS